MRIIAASLIVVAAFAAAPAFAQSLVGAWSAKVVTPQGEFAETLTVAEADGGYTVTAEPAPGGPAGAAGPSEATGVALDGDNFTFNRSVTTPQGAIDIAYAGTVSGDTFTGTATTPFGEMAYTGERQ
jgi:hypothetical protein